MVVILCSWYNPCTNFVCMLPWGAAVEMGLHLSWSIFCWHGPKALRSYGHVIRLFVCNADTDTRSWLRFNSSSLRSSAPRADLEGDQGSKQVRVRDDFFTFFQTSTLQFHMKLDRVEPMNTDERDRVALWYCSFGIQAEAEALCRLYGHSLGFCEDINQACDFWFWFGGLNEENRWKRWRSVF